MKLSSKNVYRDNLMKKRARCGYFFVLPFIIGFVLFIAKPMVQSVIFSFQEITYNATGYQAIGVGLKHYKKLIFTDPTYRTLVLKSFGTMIAKTPIIIFFSFFTAILLNDKFKGRTLARAILFLPVILSSSTLLGMSVDEILSSSSGGTGISDAATTAVLSSRMTALMNAFNLPTAFTEYITGAVDGIAEIIMASGVQILLFLAALQTITASQLEAARVEGANAWEIFWKITFPILSPIILVNTLYTIIDLTASNDNNVVSSIVNSYNKLKIGEGSAMAWIYLLLVLLLISLAYGLMSRAVFYQSKRD